MCDTVRRCVIKITDGNDKFASVNTIHRHNLRGAQHNLFIPRPNTEALKKSFRYRGAVTWNSPQL